MPNYTHLTIQTGWLDYSMQIESMQSLIIVLLVVIKYYLLVVVVVIILCLVYVIWHQITYKSVFSIPSICDVPVCIEHGLDKNLTVPCSLSGRWRLTSRC